MATAIKHLLETGKLHDVCFIVGPNKVRIGVVGDLVVIHSDVLRRMLKESDLRETGDVEMPDIYPDAVNIFLKFAYGAFDSHEVSADMSGWDTQTVLHVTNFAEKYNVPKLKKQALSQLSLSTVDDVFPAFIIFNLYNATDLEPFVLKMIQEQTMQVLEHPEFLDISVEMLVYILKQDKLNVESEVYLWKAALAWAKHQSKSKDVQAVRSILKEPLRHLRLYTLTGEEFWTEVQPTNFFTTQETLDYSASVYRKLFTSHTGLFSGNRNKRITQCITECVDLQCHAIRQYSFNSTSYNIKVHKRAMKLHSLVCYGRYDQPAGAYTSTVTVCIARTDKSETASSAPFKHTGKFEYGTDIVLPLHRWGLEGVTLKPDSEYRLDISFSEGLPTRSSVNSGGSFCSGHQFTNGYLKCRKIESNRTLYSSHIKQLHLSY